MRLPLQLTLLALSYVTRAHPTHIKRDANFLSFQGLTHVSKDHSGKSGDLVGKYFHESTFNPHYDGRFAEDVLPNDIRLVHLRTLTRTYLSTMHDLGVLTWIMHGSLLGWWWSRSIMPWDSDLDVQVSESGISYLAQYYNMTVHHFRSLSGEVGGKGKTYLLEINPHYVDGSTQDSLNVIDARWIDVDTGLFIDITTLRRDRTAESTGDFGKLICKDKHHYLHSEIFPLRDTVFEGMNVKVPYAYSQILEEEYGPEALTETEFEGHRFDEGRGEWVLINAQP